ncbi:MAG: class I tRNA ligase family protein [Thermoplasmata archaeon]
MSRIYIGVAWPYANGPLHLGHIAGCYLPPDIFARFLRMNYHKVLMTSGSDCHGTPITVTAEKEGVSPSEIATRYHRLNSETLKKFGISFDLFTTTMTDNHREVVHDVFMTLLNKGYIYKKTVELTYCPKCKRFLPDRYVEGTCPFCNFAGARGDQCDSCGKTLDPDELLSPKCKLCGEKPEKRPTEHFFLKLSEFEDKLKKWVEAHPHWRPNVKNFTYNWLQGGLKDRAITRDLEWGIPIPIEGYESKRIYVWFEAVIGYFSSCKEYSKVQGNNELWKRYWVVGEGDDEVKHPHEFHALVNRPLEALPGNAP